MILNLFRKKLKVLGVDDNETQQVLYERIFSESHGFIYKGISGLQAFNGIKVQHFDIVILDWNFKTTEENGRSIEDFLRFQKKYLGAIIFITSNKQVVEILRDQKRMVAKKIVEPEKLRELCRNLKDLDRPTVLEKLEELSDFQPKALIPGQL